MLASPTGPVMTSPRRHFWIFHLLTILVCAFFAARAAGRLVAGMVLERLPASPRPGVGPLATATADAPPAPARAIEAVVTRNIFCSTCEPSAPTPASEGGGAVVDGAPTKTSLKLRLLATLVRDDDPRASVAFIVDTGTAQTGVYGVGDKLADGVSVLEIALRQVLIRNAGRQELITLGDGEVEPLAAKSKDVEPGPFNRPEPLEGLEGLANGIRHVAEKRYAIERATLNKALADSSLFAGVRAIPSMKDGQLIGFAVYAKVGSIPSLLGLFSGDVIQAVNGQAVYTPEKALEVIRGLRSASQLTLSFQRRGVPLTHDYLIR